MSASTPTAAGLWALLLSAPLAGCAAFGPNLTGAWTGECTLGTATGDVPYTVALDLKEDGGEVSGDGTLDIADPFAEPISVEVSVSSGLRRFGTAALIVKSDSGGRLDLEGEVTDNSFTGDCFVESDWGQFELERD